MTEFSEIARILPTPGLTASGLLSLNVKVLLTTFCTEEEKVPHFVHIVIREATQHDVNSSS
jgi:hypothetical protein